MNEHSIFYIINGQFYENSDSNSKKLKKITLIFENEKAKTLRDSALKKFTEIRNTFLIKNNAAAPKYHVTNTIGKNTCVDAIENVPFFTSKSKLNLALTLSFGIKESSENYNLIDSDKYPYNKNLYPISAIGSSLNDIEETLKVNLILEKQFYEIYNQEITEVNSIKNFIDVNFLKDYIIFNCNQKPNGFQKSDLLKEALENKIFDIFPTSQFYSYEKEINLVPAEATFLELFEHHSKRKQTKKELIYKKELENLSEFYKSFSGSDISFLDSTSCISRKLNGYYLKPFFTKKQYGIYEEIAKLENKFRENSWKNTDMKSLIEKWL